jgi:hypothetical protein
MVSHRSSRRLKPAWWSDADWETTGRRRVGPMENYYQAKLAADEELYRTARRRGPGFAAINVRPGTLTLEPAGGVDLGKNKTLERDCSREAVAQVIDELLAAEGVKTCWLDLADGDESVKDAVTRVVRDGVDAIEGEAIAKEA